MSDSKTETTPEDRDPREFDVVVFGATGFTGGLVAEYLLENESLPVERWALAGRDKVKLSELRARLGQRFAKAKQLELITADSSEPASLRAMAERAHVVLTTVGPYAKYGEPLVSACIESGTDYVDLTGEPSWWKAMIDRYDAAARAAGVRVVPCCGFDSIPHDLGVLFTLDAFEPALSRDADVQVAGYVAAKGSFSGGTWASALGAMAELELPFGGGGSSKGGGSKSRGSKGGARSGSGGGGGLRGPHRARDIDGKWVVPLPTIDPLVVRRSAKAMSDYPQGFRYQHYMSLKDAKMMVGLMGGVGSVMLLSQFGPTRRLLQRVRPSGAGPDEKTRAKSWFKVTFVARGGGQKVVTRVSGGDPGYGETSKMIAESALCLAQDRSLLPDRYGVLTPAAAMGHRLIERLQRRGIQFSVLERD